MAECFLGAVGGGLKQYNKKDCTFTDAVSIYGSLYAPYAQINFPQGITFGDIVLMRVRQYCSKFSGGNDQYIYKQTETTVVPMSYNSDISTAATSIILPLQTEVQHGGTEASVLEVTIVATK